MLPLRDMVAFCVWFASYFDNKVQWRGEIFVLENGKIRPALSREQDSYFREDGRGQSFRSLVSTSLPPHFASTHPVELSK